MTKYVLITHFFPPDEGGIQRSASQIARALGDQVTVVAPPTAGSQLFDQQQTFKIIRRPIFDPRMKPSWVWLCWWLWRAKGRGMKTVLFGHYSSAVIAAWLLKPWGIKYVVFVHGRDFLTETKRISGRVLRPVLRGAEWIGVNSNYVASLVSSYGVASGRIIRTHPAVPDQYLTVPLAVPIDRLVTVGRLIKRKNIDKVLLAVAEIKKLGNNVGYDVIGDGPEMESLKQLATELGINERVIFHGAIDDKRRDQIMSRALAFIMVPILRENGIDVEGLGLVYLEAAAMGLPIIASPTGGVPDVVDQGLTGEFVDPDSINDITRGIIKVMHNSDTNYGQKGRAKMAMEFSESVRSNRVRVMLGEKQPEINISVIIPAWNAAKVIGATMKTLFAQTLLPKQVIIVDDGSTDDLARAVSEYSNQVTLIKQDHAGAAVARNTGGQVATGEYVIFLDADIELKPKMLEELSIALTTQPEAAYAYSSYIFGPKKFKIHDFNEAALKKTNYIHTSALIRRECWPGFDEKLTKFQDWDLWLTMLAQGRRGVWMPKVLFRVKQETGVMSAWRPKFMYRLPFIGQGRGDESIKKYRQAEKIIRTKHRL